MLYITNCQSDNVILKFIVTKTGRKNMKINM